MIRAESLQLPKYISREINIHKDKIYPSFAHAQKRVDA